MLTFYHIYHSVCLFMGFPDGSDNKESACNTGDLGSIPGSGRPPGQGNGNPLQCYCLENPRDRGAWWAAVYGVAHVGQDLSDLVVAAAEWKSRKSRNTWSNMQI